MNEDLPNEITVETVAARAAALRQLHTGPDILVLPNAWDAASARAFAKAGFPAIATTSGGVANALGFEDHEGAPESEMSAAASRIAHAVDVPVTVDFEAGYGRPAAEIARALIASGAAGCNLEDSDLQGGSGLVDAERQAEHLASVKAALRAEGADLVLNARVDVFIQRIGTPEEQLTDGLRRARLYREAGADCIYPILLSDEAMITEFVRAVDVVNLNIRRGGSLSIERAAALGVRRLTYATSIFREMMTFVEGVAGDIRAMTVAAHGR